MHGLGKTNIQPMRVPDVFCDGTNLDVGFRLVVHLIFEFLLLLGSLIPLTAGEYERIHCRDHVQDDDVCLLTLLRVDSLDLKGVLDIFLPFCLPNLSHQEAPLTLVVAEDPNLCWPDTHVYYALDEDDDSVRIGVVDK